MKKEDGNGEVGVDVVDSENESSKGNDEKG